MSGLVGAAVIPTVRACRYVAPLREGGSLPGIVEADDYGTYVVKFRGAGQGLKVLVAEVIVAELARRLGFRVPDLKAMELAPEIAKYEADEEVQDLLNASLGLNLAVDYLPGSFGWEPGHVADPAEAGRILWLDALTANVDRQWRNPNLLVWHGDLWLIDHGAALYFHHAWSSGPRPARFADQPFDASDHVLVRFARRAAEADEDLAPQVTEGLLTAVLAQVPDEWLETTEAMADAGAVRQAYVDYLMARVTGARAWVPGRGAA